MNRWSALSTLHTLSLYHTKACTVDNVAEYYTTLEEVLDQYDSWINAEHKAPLVMAERGSEVNSIASPIIDPMTIIVHGSATGHALCPYYI